MKAFENKTNTGNEPAVKKGVSLPSDAVNIGYFSTEEITPERHLSVTDISSSIPENVSAGYGAETDTIMYADEFGVLRYARTNAEVGQIAGSPVVHNSEVSISNKLMNFTQEQINYNFTGRESDFESSFFVHSYYVSTNYVLLSSNVTEYEGIETSSELKTPSAYNIRIVDHSGKEDETVKYKILLEKYTNNSNAPGVSGSGYENLDLYRIVVLLEKADPQNLYLIYDKYEKDEDNVPYNPFFGYKEKINSVPYYNYVAEESEVIDPSSANKRVYSTQLFSYKENELLETQISNDGWRIYTPRKAIQDPRTFQSFNWRLIAKINYSLSETRNIYSNDERPVIKVGVLFSRSQEEAKNAYVFNNMQESVFNIQNYIFDNPNAQSGLNKSQKNYWLVDIDNLDNSYSNYDLLIWTPTRSITSQQAITVENIISQNTSVFVDMSTSAEVYSSGLEKFGFSEITVGNTSSGYLSINDTYAAGNTEMQAWSLSEYVETTDNKNYSIFGKRKDVLNDNSLVPLPTFIGTIGLSSKSLVSIGSNSAVIKRTNSKSNGTTSSLPASLVVTPIPLLQLINDKIAADGTQTANNGQTNIYSVGTIGNQTVTGMSEIIVGPNKFFYNVISDINTTKVDNFANRNTINNSTTLWNVSPWKNSWTINGRVNNDGQVTVLSEAEKLDKGFGFKSVIGSTESKFSRQISSSITADLIRDFEATSIGGDVQSIINQDFSNVDFYLESTNPNVDFINFDQINSAGQEISIGQVSSNHNLFKLSTAAKNQIIDGSTVSLDAVSKEMSAELNVSPGYPYIITTSSQYQERNGNNIKTPNDLLPGSQGVKDYSFAFNTQVSINQITKTVNKYKISWSTPFTSEVTGFGDFANYVIEKARISGSLARTDYTVAQSDENKIEVDKIYSPFNDYNYPSRIFSRTDIRSLDQDSTSSSLNNFHYTGDIDQGNRWDEYRINYDSGTSRNNVTESPSNAPSVLTIYGKVYKGSKLTVSDIYQALISPTFSWKTFFGQACMVDEIWYKDLEPEYFFSTVISGINFNKKFINLVKQALNALVPIGVSDAQMRETLGLAPNITRISASAYFPAKYNTNAKKLQLAQLILSYINRPIKTVVASSVDYYFVEKNAPVITKSNSSSSSSNSGSDYIKYIQYTLSKQGYKITVNGTYDRNTYIQVKNFQSTKSQSFIDGIVDSETKSVLATYWLGLYKNNIDRYNSELTAAPADAKKYIIDSVKYSDIANIGTPGKEYRRISFTGTAGPTEVVDYFICKVPQVASGQKVHSVTIRTGGWSTLVEAVYVYEEDFDVNKIFTQTVEGTKIPNASPKVSWLPGDQNISANSTRLINFDTYDGVENIKYVMIKLKSKKLPSKYGPNAEGFSVADISFSLSADGTPIPPKYGNASDSFKASVNGTITGYTIIESSEQKALNLSTISTAIKTADAIEEIEVSNISIAVSDSGVSKTIVHTMPSSEKERKGRLNSPYYFTESYGSDGNIAITINALTESLSLYNSNPTITGAEIQNASGYQVTPSNAFSLSKIGTSNLYLIQTTNGVKYDSIETSPVTAVENFYIEDADNIGADPESRKRQDTKLTINVKDGLVVLTNKQGKPIGFPNFGSYTPSGANSIYGFGFINLLWSDTTPAPYGLDWQFLHIDPSSKQKTFLGRKISYQEYTKKGSNNVFIGLNAFDADSSSNTGSNIVSGSSRNGTLQVLDNPTRYLCPVYSVKVKNRPKISVSGPSNNLSKFDTWYINLTQGKFIKQIKVPASYNFTNWMKEYKGRDIKSYYDTTSIKTPYSSIFGFGYYDIYEENPKIISDNEIRLRQEKVHAVQEQYDKQLSGLITNGTKYTDASPIVPWINVFVKNANGKWIEVPKKDIRSFDKHTGIIVFKKELVPLQEKDIKVNYTIKNSSIMVHQINGQRLNINPYNGLSLDQPLFIYALPIKCVDTNNGTVSEVEGFSNSNPIAATYDSSIFNIKSSSYNPFALHLATVKVNNFYNFDNVKVEDMRVRGGGIKHNVDIINEYESNRDILSFADLYSGKGFLHPNGGYVIIRIPKEVINNFNSKQEVYNIVRNNLTAGVSFDIQDVDGTDWRSIIDVE